jgi:hypothetical protein
MDCLQPDNSFSFPFANFAPLRLGEKQDFFTVSNLKAVSRQGAKAQSSQKPWQMTIGDC